MKTIKTIVIAASLTTFGVADIMAQVPFAGNGTPGYSGDGGAATSAQLSYVTGISSDATGNIFISDAGNSDVRMVNTSNTISTYAGNQTAGFSGDGGAATSASMQGNGFIANDGAGNLYISDAAGTRIRKVTASTGVITTIAGTGTAGNTGNGGAATLAQITVNSLAVDASGNIYFTDAANSIVRQINTSGTISVYAGNGTAGYSGDGGAATSAQLSLSSYYSLGNALTVDVSGNLYISDAGNSVVRKVNTSGTISTYAGNGGFTHSGDGGAATSASIKNLGPIAMNAAGDLFIAAHSSTSLPILRRVDAAGTITTDRDSSWFQALGISYGVSFNMFHIDINNNLYFDIMGGCAIGTAPGTVYKLALTQTPRITMGSIITSPPSIEPTDVPALSVFSPNEDGKDDKTMLMLAGNKIEIYNRNGSLVRTLEGSKVWDGKDYSGTVVPMGYYVAMSKETNASTNISVVK